VSRPDLEAASRDLTDGLRTLAARLDDRTAHDLHAAPEEARVLLGPALLDDARTTFSELIDQLAAVTRQSMETAA
jgi:hypothetical protein